jgi:hypothetical protein
VTLLEQAARQRRRRRPLFPRWLAFALSLVAAFIVGLAFGQALDDEPAAGNVVTSVRTLTPLPQQAPTRTVTVTVTSP